MSPSGDDQMTSGFGETSTTDEVLAGRDLTGERYLVTGSSGGLGLETVRALASHGAQVVMAARDPAKNRRAADSIRERHPDAVLEILEVDLGSLESVRRAVDEVMEAGQPLHGIVANAGIMATPYSVSVDGHESQFAVDHLGHFLLVRQLLPLLSESAATRGTPSRVVVVSSAGHRMGDVDLDDVDFTRRAYDPFVAYGAAKTCNVLHAIGIDRRWKDRGVRGFAIHPGGIHTELGRYMTPEVVESLLSRMEGGASFMWKSVEQGAATQVWALTAPFLEGRGGLYCEDCEVSPVIEDEGVLAGRGVAARAVDHERAEALWVISDRLVD